jgi:solute carrier family 6 amino acid transporter-like protein 5/7/9/14
MEISLFVLDWSVQFPIVAYKNGGGAFLIPYMIVLFVIGKPLYFLELAVGQFSGFGPIKIWKMSPICKGVGYASSFALFCVNSFYCAIMAISLRFIVVSWQSPLPWAKCNPDWALKNIRCFANGTVFDSNGTKTNIPTIYLQ